MFLLYVAGGKIDSQSDLVKITGGEFLADMLAFFTNLQHDLDLVVDIFRKIRMIKRLILAEQSRIRLHKYHRDGRNGIIQLFGMFGIIAADSDYLHLPNLRIWRLIPITIGRL